MNGRNFAEHFLVKCPKRKPCLSAKNGILTDVEDFEHTVWISE